MNQRLPQPSTQSGSPSPCPRKSVCGSCSWSDIPYQQQLAMKLDSVNEALFQHETGAECRSIIPSPVTEHYRNRMDFVIDFEGRVGLREKGKWWRVIDDHTCFISDSAIERAFAIVRSWVNGSGLSCFDRKKHTGLLRYAVIRSNRSGDLLVSVVTSSPSDEGEAQEVKDALIRLSLLLPTATVLWATNSSPADVSYGDHVEIISGAGHIIETMQERRYQIGAQSFFQTNSHAAELLLEEVKKNCALETSGTILDLFCGTGFFSVALAGKSRRVIGIELSSEAIHDAKRNAAINEVEVEFHSGKAEEMHWSEYAAELVIVDPPRAGLHPKTLKELLIAKPEILIYVSCGYKAFAKELPQLLSVYDIEAMNALDQFPHTPHVEVVTRLRRR